MTAATATDSVRLNDVLGAVEAPTADAPPCTGGFVIVSGWVLAVDGVPLTVVLRCPGLAPCTARLGLTRSDVGAAFPELAHARRAGYIGLLDVHDLPAGVHQITVEAGSADTVRRRWTVSFRRIDDQQAYLAWRSRQPLLKPAAALPGNLRGQTGGRLSVIVRRRSVADSQPFWETLRSLDLQVERALDIVSLGAGHLPRWWSGPHATDWAEALSQCQGNLMAVLDEGDLLEPVALRCIAHAAALNPGAALLYADHEQRSTAGTRPIFKPAWSPRLYTQWPSLLGPWYCRRAALVEALAHRSDAAVDDQTAVWQDVAAAAAVVAHVPAVLASRPRSPDLPTVQPRDAPAARWRIGVVIPTRLADKVVLARCLDGLAAATAAGWQLDLRVVLNNLEGTSEDDAVAFLSRWPVVPVAMDGDFNWSALNNAAAEEMSADLLLFLNDDVEPLAPGWLPSMATLAMQPDVGAVGAVLRYPDGRIQHAGVFISSGERLVSRHTLRFCRGDEPHIESLLACDREQTAVTGACLMTRRAVFEAVGGFDEQLSLVFNDVDYCLRLSEHGLRCVVAAGATLVHHEGLSRGGMSEGTDQQAFEDRWSGCLPAVDAFYNPHLRSDSDDWTLDPSADPPATVRPVRGRSLNESVMSTDQAWQQWGEQDPYFGVITDPKYRSRNLTQEAKDAFFASGRSHVHHVLNACRKQLLRSEYQPQRVLDFGCGVGRLVVPFAEQVEQVVGIDVSAGMLVEARRNCEERGLNNVTLVLSDDTLSALEGSFDLIHSAIVFQHIDVPRGRNLFRMLLQRLTPGGVGVLHVTYAKDAYADNWGQPPATAPAPAARAPQPRPRGLRELIPFAKPATTEAARGPGSDGKDPEMLMNTYNLNELVFMIQKLGVRRMTCEFTDHGGELGVMLYFQRP